MNQLNQGTPDSRKLAGRNGLWVSHSNQIRRCLRTCLGLTALYAISFPVLAATAPDLGSTDPFALVSETYSNSTAGTAITGDVCFTTGPSTTPTISGSTETPCSSEKGTDQNNALANLNSQSCEPLGLRWHWIQSASTVARRVSFRLAVIPALAP